MLFFFQKFRIAFLFCPVFFLSCLARAQQDGQVKPAEETVVAQQAPEHSEDDMDFGNPFQSALPEEQIEIRREMEREEEAEPEEKFDDSGLKVSGLVWGEAAPKAIINDSIYGIGDEINGAKILSIGKDGILLMFKSREYLMKRGGSEISEKGGA